MRLTRKSRGTLIVSMDTQKRGDSTHEGVLHEEAAHDQDTAEYADAFGARVRLLRGRMSRQDFAHALGIHSNTVGKFERGDSMPDAYLLNRMCNVGGRSPQWLITGNPAESDKPGKSLLAVELGEFVWVPLFDIKASAGNGVFNDLETVIAMRPFDSGFIRGELGIAHNELAMCQIVGDSAAPRLNSKDSVLVDRRDREVHTEGLHIVRLDGALLAKRIQRLPARVLRVSSTNTAYSSFDIDIGTELERDFQVIGRVRWGGVIFQ